MSIPPRDSSKKSTVTRSQARRNPDLAREIDGISQGPFFDNLKTFMRLRRVNSFFFYS